GSLAPGTISRVAGCGRCKRSVKRAVERQGSDRLRTGAVVIGRRGRSNVARPEAKAAEEDFLLAVACIGPDHAELRFGNIHRYVIADPDPLSIGAYDPRLYLRIERRRTQA